MIQYLKSNQFFFNSSQFFLSCTMYKHLTDSIGVIWIQYFSWIIAF